MRFIEGNLSYGQFKFLFINEELSFIETQKHIVFSFFELANSFFMPYGVELCFEKFDPKTQLVLTKKEFEAFVLKTEHPHIDFSPIWTNSKEIISERIDIESVFAFVLKKNNENHDSETLTGLSHLSFQSGLFRLPEKNEAKMFFLEKENQIHNAIEHPCFSEEWFEAPLKKTFFFPPMELNFSREPYSKAWSLLISLNWDIYSLKNEQGFKLLSSKFELLLKNGWIDE